MFDYLISWKAHIHKYKDTAYGQLLLRCLDAENNRTIFRNMDLNLTQQTIILFFERTDSISASTSLKSAWDTTLLQESIWLLKFGYCLESVWQQDTVHGRIARVQQQGSIYLLSRTAVIHWATDYPPQWAVHHLKMTRNNMLWNDIY